MCAIRNKQIPEPLGVGAGPITGCGRHGEGGKGKGKGKGKFMHRHVFLLWVHGRLKIVKVADLELSVRAKRLTFRAKSALGAAKRAISTAIRTRRAGCLSPSLSQALSWSP
jgi:hypothetical protein